MIRVLGDVLLRRPPAAVLLSPSSQLLDAERLSSGIEPSSRPSFSGSGTERFSHTHNAFIAERTQQQNLKIMFTCSHKITLTSDYSPKPKQVFTGALSETLPFCGARYNSFCLIKVTWKWYFVKIQLLSCMCFDEWNVNKQLTKVLKNQFLSYLQI